jgi:hypothetical protein
LNQHWANYAYGCEVEVPSGTTVLLKENQISIFPNPIVNKLNVSITDWQDFPLSAEIYDMQGKVVMTFSIDSPQLSIELKEMATANYLLFLKNSASEFVGTKKLMVQ